MELNDYIKNYSDLNFPDEYKSQKYKIKYKNKNKNKTI